MIFSVFASPVTIAKIVKEKATNPAPKALAIALIRVGRKFSVVPISIDIVELVAIKELCETLMFPAKIMVKNKKAKPIIDNRSNFFILGQF